MRWEVRLFLVWITLLPTVILFGVPPVWTFTAVPAVILATIVGLFTIPRRSRLTSKRFRRAHRRLWAARSVRIRRRCIRYGWLIVGGAVAIGAVLVALTFVDRRIDADLHLLEMLAQYVVVFTTIVVGSSLWVGVRDGWDARCPRCDGVISTRPIPLRCPSCSWVIVPQHVRRGRLVRNRWVGGGLLALGSAAILLPFADYTPLGTGIASTLPTRTLLVYTSHGYKGGSMLNHSARRVLIARIDDDADARDSAVDFIVESLTTRELDDTPLWLKRWLGDGLRDGRFTPDELDRLAEEALRGVADDRRYAEWVWINIEQLEPEAAARARERVE